jgi:hypothetical protein
MNDYQYIFVKRNQSFYLSNYFYFVLNCPKDFYVYFKWKVVILNAMQLLWFNKLCVVVREQYI